MPNKNIFAHSLIQTKKYCVYGLICPIDFTLKYVGCTKNINSRILGHYSETTHANGNKKAIWVMELKTKGLFPLPLIIKQFDNTESAKKFELNLIKNCFGLLNKQKGNSNYGKRKFPKKV